MKSNLLKQSRPEKPFSTNRRIVCLRLAIIFSFVSMFMGCASLLVDPLLDPLTLSIQRQTDIELLYEGSPALLLMIDGFIAEDPRNKKLLISGIQAYAASASAMDEAGRNDRAVTLSVKAKKYGMELLKLSSGFNNNLPKSLTDFTWDLSACSKEEVASLFWSGYGWATWIGFQNGSPSALADLPKLEQIMLRVLELDESFYYGSAHLFLGYYYGSRPKMLGGKPEESRKHFERALVLSNRQFLLTQVLFAESYARMTFDRELFESLLKEVLNHSSDEINELSFSNKLAQLRARKLLDQIDTFF